MVAHLCAGRMGMGMGSQKHMKSPHSMLAWVCIACTATLWPVSLYTLQLFHVNLCKAVQLSYQEITDACQEITDA